MSNFSVDKKFINLISNKLNLFKWTDENTACFRCPLCGDSKKNKTKKRGYFYKFSDQFMFRCHNCSASCSFDTFLKGQDPTLHKEFVYEKFKHSNDYRWGSNRVQRNAVVVGLKQPVEYKCDYIDVALSGLKNIEELPNGHKCKEYVINRKIPKEFWSNLYYTQNYRKWVNEFIIKDKFKTLSETDERLVIPFFKKSGKVFAYQGRYLGSNCNITKYITVKKETEYPDDILIYGLDRVDFNKTVYVCEGPIDSMFIPNCIAVSGSSLKKMLKYKGLDLVFIFDNQPRNEVIVKLLENMIKLNKKVVIFPEYIKGKDINDLIKNGLTPEKVYDMVQSNTFDGLNAQLQFAKWSKIYG
jgi:hypothetical protein